MKHPRTKTPDQGAAEAEQQQQPGSPDQPGVKTPQQMLQEMQQRQLQFAATTGVPNNRPIRHPAACLSGLNHRRRNNNKARSIPEIAASSPIGCPDSGDGCQGAPWDPVLRGPVRSRDGLSARVIARSLKQLPVARDVAFRNLGRRSPLQFRVQSGLEKQPGEWLRCVAGEDVAARDPYTDHFLASLDPENRPSSPSKSGAALRNRYAHFQF